MLVPVHVDDGGCDGDAHTQGSRQQAAHAAQLNLRRKKHIRCILQKITDSGMHCNLDNGYSCAYTVKEKSIVFPFPRRDVTNQTLPGRELLNYSRPGRVWLVTPWLGTGKTITFFTVYLHPPLPLSVYRANNIYGNEFATQSTPPTIIIHHLFVYITLSIKSACEY
jgi:hypothetical protein